MQTTLFEDARMTITEAMEMTVASIRAHGPHHRHWCVSWSGGKDSTATLTLLLHLLDTAAVDRPERLTVLYADTRQELPPLYAAALGTIDLLRTRGVEVEVCRAEMDKRFLVYMLGRGVPPPNNNTLRWCTRQIKFDPMAAALERLCADHDGTILCITGVREGESAARDRRITMACSRDGAECGQGWYQQALPNAKGIRGRIATLAPLLHWRVCHVWGWLMECAPDPAYGGFPVRPIAVAYGGDEAEEINARTGCIGCPLASQDKALDAVIANPEWSYLAPLKDLRPLYRRLREPRNRLRKAKAEVLKDGSTAANPQRMGPLTLDARREALHEIIEIQGRCNLTAQGRPSVDILNGQEVDRILDLINTGTWPQGWDGDEPVADVPLDKIFADGSIQPLLVPAAEHFAQKL